MSITEAASAPGHVAQQLLVPAVDMSLPRVGTAGALDRTSRLRKQALNLGRLLGLRLQCLASVHPWETGVSASLYDAVNNEVDSRESSKGARFIWHVLPSPAPHDTTCLGRTRPRLRTR
jgi:hypothetical protein